jgi:hypothetical protein
MSLQDAINQLADLAPKASGHLIRHDDWNSLIAVLSEYGASLTSQALDLSNLQDKVQDLESELNTVSTQVTDLDERLEELEQQIEPLLDNYLVTLSCSRLSYAIGELCELTAKVTDLRGNPLAAPYPWVDFVAAWGRLRSKGGFVTRAGAGDNSLSVQVNAQGIAQVLLRAEHSEGFAEAEEEQVNAVINMQVPQYQMTVAQAIMQAPTPTDNQATQAYQIIHAEYERKDSIAVRAYADTYHLRNPEWLVDTAGPSYWTMWHDYRATVLAMAKPDADPTTPDGVRGSASIQVLFRDWLWSWGRYYLQDSAEMELWVGEDLAPAFQQEDVYGAFEERFQKRYKEYGIMGRKKYMEAAKKAVEKYQAVDDPHIQVVKEQIMQAIGAQEAAEVYGSGKSGAEASMLQAHIGQGKQTEAVQSGVDNVAQQVQETQGMQDSVNVLEGRMQASERLGQQINASLTLINDNVRAINPLDENSIKANVQKISADIAALKSQMG